MLLSHNDLVRLVQDKVIYRAPHETGDPSTRLLIDLSQVNAASIDLTLGRKILAELREGIPEVISLREREGLQTVSYDLRREPFLLHPGQFILAHTAEFFNFPNDISADYCTKSSMARIGLEHLSAGWCDAGWNGSVLTLELKNMTQNHVIELREGDPIGQLRFFKHEPVPEHASYATRGRYNNDSSVSGIKP